MRSKFAVAAVALALVVAASRVIANPVGVPPTAKPFDVIEDKKISIELGTPTAHGWLVLIWGSYKVGRSGVPGEWRRQGGRVQPWCRRQGGRRAVFLPLREPGQQGA